MEIYHPKKKEILPYKEVPRDTGAYKSKDLQLSNTCSTFILNNQLAFFGYQHSISFAHGLQHYKNLRQTGLHQLCGLWQESRQFRIIFWTKFDSNFMDNKLKVFKREHKNAEFRPRQNFTMGEADFNHLIRQKSQLVFAADNFLREQNMSPVFLSTVSKDMEERLKLVQNVIDIMDRPRRKIRVTLLLYKVDSRGTS